MISGRNAEDVSGGGLLCRDCCNRGCNQRRGGSQRINRINLSMIAMNQEKARMIMMLRRRQVQLNGNQSGKVEVDEQMAINIVLRTTKNDCQFSCM